MPQENGWATGAEYIEDNGNHCPYCGSEEVEDGSFDVQPGQAIQTGHTCGNCDKVWNTLYNVVGWYDEEDNLHEDTSKIDRLEYAEKTVATLATSMIDRLEYAEKTMATLAKALQDIAAITTCEGTEAEAMAAQIQGICRLALEDGN